MNAITSKQHNAAILLARRGFHVFPCLPRSKIPATAHGCKDATTDWSAIDGWWTADPSFNPAIATGKVSGTFVIDADGDEGEATLKRLEEDLGVLPPTVESITARGRHLLFKQPRDALIPNSVGKLGPGLDIRGDGGYVLAPPSVHETGWTYCWSVDCAPSIATPPDWLLCRVASKKIGNGRAEAQPATVWRKLFSDGVDEGARNDSATKLTGYLVFRRIDPLVVLDIVQLWNASRCRPPLPAEDIERIVNSVYGAENKKASRA